MSDSAPELQWMDADGYQLALDGGEIRCRNARGKPLKTIPAKARKTEAFDTLSATRELLVGHEERCRSTVLGWFLNGGGGPPRPDRGRLGGQRLAPLAERSPHPLRHRHRSAARRR
ncbi:hypothetical protein [Corynebacterium antarcticum]|uniref:hypothetical protein n=1 Tax=Corynebacterium antarcticum TaxID=2800405 RepID=UPI0020039D16|nr:hypothetical protein [Corynebacterium antarcticum]MCK7661919.1 hypothetical protein [Corynebacterium antarcticum]